MSEEGPSLRQRAMGLMCLQLGMFSVLSPAGKDPAAVRRLVDHMRARAESAFGPDPYVRRCFERIDEELTEFRPLAQ